MAAHFDQQLPLDLPDYELDYYGTTDSVSTLDDDSSPGETSSDEGTEALESPNLYAQSGTQSSPLQSLSELTRLVARLVASEQESHEINMAPDDRTIQTLFAELKSKQPSTRRRAAIELRNAVFAAYRGKSFIH